MLTDYIEVDYYSATSLKFTVTFFLFPRLSLDQAHLLVFFYSKFLTSFSVSIAFPSICACTLEINKTVRGQRYDVTPALTAS